MVGERPVWRQRLGRRRILVGYWCAWRYRLGRGRRIVRVAARWGRRIGGTRLRARHAAPPTEAPSITAPPATAARLILMALPPQELLQAQLKVGLQGVPCCPITGLRAAITLIQPATKIWRWSRAAGPAWVDTVEKVPLRDGQPQPFRTRDGYIAQFIGPCRFEAGSECWLLTTDRVFQR